MHECRCLEAKTRMSPPPRGAPAQPLRVGLCEYEGIKLLVPWPANLCILCLEEKELVTEHLIPEALGGLLKARFLCRSCNSTLGAKFEAAARSDPSIRLAVSNLSSRIPELAQRLIESQPFLGESMAGQVRGYIRGGQFRVHSTREKDGSLIQPTDQARRTVDTILRKSGYGPTPLEAALQAFDNAPVDQRTEIAPGLEVVKWGIQKVQQDLSRPLMDPLVPLKIAFEFLACHLGTSIYGDVPQLAEIRHVLRAGEGVSKCIDVDRLSGEEYRPFHGLCFEGNCPHARVQIRLFGWLAFRVHFYGLAVAGPRFAYTHDLESNQESIGVVDSESMR